MKTFSPSLAVAVLAVLPIFLGSARAVTCFLEDDDDDGSSFTSSCMFEHLSRSRLAPGARARVGMMYQPSSRHVIALNTPALCPKLTGVVFTRSDVPKSLCCCHRDGGGVIADACDACVTVVVLLLTLVMRVVSGALLMVVLLSPFSG